MFEIVFAVRDEYSKERIDKVFDYLTEKRNVDSTQYTKQREFSKHFFGSIQFFRPENNNDGLEINDNF